MPCNSFFPPLCFPVSVVFLRALPPVLIQINEHLFFMFLKKSVSYVLRRSCKT